MGNLLQIYKKYYLLRKIVGAIDLKGTKVTKETKGMKGMKGKTGISVVSDHLFSPFYLFRLSATQQIIGRSPRSGMWRNATPSLSIAFARDDESN